MRLPWQTVDTDKSSTSNMSPFGWALREAHYQFGDRVVNLNHGSYGVPPTDVLEARIKAIKEEMAFPDEYIRLKHDDIATEARQILANHLDAELDNVVLCVNATTAINAVLRSYPFEEGDTIVTFDSIYGSCLNTLHMLTEKFGLKVVLVPMEFPLSDDEIVKRFDHALRNTPNVVMGMFDTVSSMPGFHFPWERLAKLCRKRGVLSLVDGAHGIGLIPISLKTARPDFFATNAHKWFSAGHSVAALYVDPEHHRMINSFPVSATYIPMSAKLSASEERTALARSFVYVGTADHSAVQSIMAADKFRREVCGGEAAIMAYQAKLSKEASEYLCRELKTTEISDSGNGKRNAMFTLVYPLQPPKEEHAELIKFSNEYMMKEWKTIVPLGTHHGKVNIRFSAAMYLDMNDFKFALTVIRATMKAWQDRDKSTS